MDYIIIDQDDLNMVNPVECGDIPAVQRSILEKLKNGRTPRVFVEVPFDVNVKVKEDKIGEAPKSKAKPDKGPGGPGDRAVRPGDEGDTPELGQGSGNTEPGPGAEN
uniref:Uncharacterized protein n=1 Tax=viral metagenome TaxID=1070528 RepID=A0A6H2A231_9ZZZZ